MLTYTITNTSINLIIFFISVPLHFDFYLMQIQMLLHILFDQKKHLYAFHYLYQMLKSMIWIQFPSEQKNGMN